MAARMPAVAKARKPLLVRRERLRVCRVALCLDERVAVEDFVDLPRELELRLRLEVPFDRPLPVPPAREGFDADELLRLADPCLEALARVEDDDALDVAVRLRDPDDLGVGIVRSSFVLEYLLCKHGMRVSIV